MPCSASLCMGCSIILHLRCLQRARAWLHPQLTQCTACLFACLSNLAHAACRMEGPDCTININECLRGTDNCAPNAACIDTNGSFACECWLGYTGDGIRSCTPTAALQVSQDLLWHIIRPGCTQSTTSLLCRSDPGWVMALPLNVRAQPDVGGWLQPPHL